MGSDWKEYRLGDLTDWSSGGTPSKKKNVYWNGDIPWISASSMAGNRYENSELKITKKGLEAGSRLVPENTILLLVRGSALHKRMPVGITLRPVAFNQDVKAIRIKEEVQKKEIIDPWFLLYWFTAKESELLNIVENTGIGAGKFDTKQLQDLVINVPPKVERERIVATAKSIDDKIEVNTQTNQTLEQIAQAIFKSWFVDFGPVKAKMAVLEAGGTAEQAELAAMSAISAKDEAALKQLQAEQSDADAQGSANVAGGRMPGATYAELAQTAALFPSAMEDAAQGSANAASAGRAGAASELGETNLSGTNLDAGSGGPKGGGMDSRRIPAGWTPVRMDSLIELAYGKALKKTDRIEGEFPVYGSGGITGTHNKPLVEGPGIIVGRKGTVGSIYWEQQNFYPIDTVFYVKPKDGVSLEYVYYLLQTLGLDGMNTDAAVPGLNRNNVYRLEVPDVPAEVLKRFTAVTRKISAQIASLTVENVSLIGLRNTLLPKLLSGEIELSNADNRVESIA